MDLSAYKAISINGIAMKRITIGGVVAWIRPAINWVRRSINADGTIYNGTGYKDGYRIRSGGAEATNANSSITGFIKVSPGDVIRWSGWDFFGKQASNAVNASDASFANIGQFTMQPSLYGIFVSGGNSYDYGASSVVEEKTGVYKWVVPPASSGVAYIRITGYEASSGGIGAKMIVTINEEIV